MSNPPALEFSAFKISKIIFDRIDLFVDGEYAVNIQFINEYPDSENNLIFHSVFIINLNGLKQQCNIQVQAIGVFKIQGEVDEKVRENYTLISAPSIVFPYIRAFISNLMLQTGAGPIILPPINFIAKYLDDINKKKEAVEAAKAESKSE